MKPPDYYKCARHELIDFVPGAANRILDCGCGSGIFGKTIKQRQKCALVGIELNRHASGLARNNIDYTIKADLNTFDFTTLKTDFDLIIFSDILEHLINPHITLKKALTKLTPNGSVLISIPNIAHPSILKQLKAGLFRYTAAGILDNTHLRFFTKTTITQLLAALDLKIKKLRPYPSKENPIQYHILAQPVKELHGQPKTTIIIPTFNCMAYTKQTISSLYATEQLPFKLIVIDNNSTDETVTWLRSMDNFLHIENEQNLGFSISNNLGLELVKTPSFILANNDLVFTPHATSRLFNRLYSDQQIGIVGPLTNYASGPQVIKNVPYNNTESLYTFSEQIRSSNIDKTMPFHRIVFFCTIFKSELLQKVGLLDENFIVGNFEDDDYCRRAISAGYKLLIDKSVFVHHYGSQTWKENNLDYKLYMEHNKTIFTKKYGL